MTEQEFLHLALHSYSNVQCNTVSEFEDDLKKIQIIRKMLTRYQTLGDISARLVLNHIVILFNVFGNTALDLLLYKVPKEQYPLLVPFILFIDRMDELKLEQLNIIFHEGIMEELRNI